MMNKRQKMYVVEEAKLEMITVVASTLGRRIPDMEVKNMKERVTMIIENFYAGALFIAAGSLELFSLICFGLIALIRISIKTAGIIKEAYRQVARKAIREVREMRACYWIPATEYADYLRMECTDLWNSFVKTCFKLAGAAKETYQQAVRQAVHEAREIRACYWIPIIEYVEYIRMECVDAWNFRNEIIVENKA